MSKAVPHHASDLKSGRRFGDGSIMAGWLLIAAGVVLALVPWAGFLVYLIAGPLLLVAAALALAAMIRGRAFAGAVLMLAAFAATPLAFLVLPVVSTAIWEGVKPPSDKTTPEPHATGAAAENPPTASRPSRRVEPSTSSSESSPEATAEPNHVLAETPEQVEDDPPLHGTLLLPMRTWHDNKGRPVRASLAAVTTINGRFTGTFRRPDGSTFAYAIGDLSEEDVELVKRRMERD